MVIDGLADTNGVDEFYGRVRRMLGLTQQIEIYRQHPQIGMLTAQQWLASFSPWRALVAAHLWAFSIRQARDRRLNSTERNRV